MMEMIYLGIGIILLIVLNTLYVGWRGGHSRKAEAERNDSFNSR